MVELQGNKPPVEEIIIPDALPETLKVYGVQILEEILIKKLFDFIEIHIQHIKYLHLFVPLSLGSPLGRHSLGSPVRHWLLSSMQYAPLL